MCFFTPFCLHNNGWLDCESLAQVGIMPESELEPWVSPVIVQHSSHYITSDPLATKFLGKASLGTQPIHMHQSLICCSAPFSTLQGLATSWVKWYLTSPQFENCWDISPCQCDDGSRAYKSSTKQLYSCITISNERLAELMWRCVGFTCLKCLLFSFCILPVFYACAR